MKKKNGKNSTAEGSTIWLIVLIILFVFIVFFASL